MLNCLPFLCNLYELRFFLASLGSVLSVRYMIIGFVFALTKPVMSSAVGMEHRCVSTSLLVTIEWTHHVSYVMCSY
jgi:hypothetical protein